MQRVEDFSELFRLESKAKKNKKSKPWSSDAFTIPVYLQTNPRHRRPDEATEKKQKRS